MAFGFTDVLNAGSDPITGNILKSVNSTYDSIGSVGASAADYITPGTALGNSYTPTSNLSQQTSDPASVNSDRLMFVHPRSAASSYMTEGTDPYTADRGPIAKIKLLTDNKGSLDDRQVKDIDLKNEIQQLTSSTGYSKFFLTDVQIAYSEKTQISSTFGDGEVVYYFGRQPIMFTMSGILFDALQEDWFSKFVALYATTFRGTQLAQHFELIEILLPNMKLVGTVTNLTTSQNSARDSEVAFSMQFIAKEATPLPMTKYSGDLQSIGGTLIDFSIGKGGFGEDGWGVALGTIGGGFMEATSIFGDLADSISSIAGGFGAAINSFRSSIFSPVYGIISSITKLISTNGGTLSKIISSFTNPVNAILRDVTNISSMIVGLANMIDAQVAQIAGAPRRSRNNINNTLNSLKYAAGVVSRLPETLSQTVKRQRNMGRVKIGAALLSGGKNNNKSKTPVLSSGKPYTPQSANKI